MVLRFYAIAVPAYLLVLYTVFCLSYHASCLLSTPPPEDMSTICDKHAVSPALSTNTNPPRGSGSGLSSHSNSYSSVHTVHHTLSQSQSHSHASQHPLAPSPPASSPYLSYASRSGGQGQIPDQFDLDPRLVSKVLAGSGRRR
jgi:hypothetical protein